MPDINLEDLAILRIVVGFLGEKEQFGWWTSSFFSEGSGAFLSPIFSRTQLLTQTTGVSQAATLIHDERIGIGDVYHLFRLPEELAQGIHQTVQDPELSQVVTNVINIQATALEYLKKNVEFPSDDDIGPVRIGDRSALFDMDQWDIVRAYYAKAFTSGIQIFPYFSGGGR